MANKRVLTNKNYGWFFAPATAVADIEAITAAEAATFINITDAVKLDGTDFNTAASETSDDRSFADAAGAQAAGNGDFSGRLSGFTAQDSDTSSTYRIAQTGIKTNGSDIVLLARPVESASAPLAAGDEYNAWHVLSDAPADVRGDSSYSWAVALLPQSDMAIRGIIASDTPGDVAVTLVAGTLAPGISRLKAVYGGHTVTIGAHWTSSDTAIATVSEHGVVEVLTSGSATIMATYPGAGASTGISIPVV
jgi:hypothetical protein